MSVIAGHIREITINVVLDTTTVVKQKNQTFLYIMNVMNKLKYIGLSIIGFIYKEYLAWTDRCYYIGQDNDYILYGKDTKGDKEFGYYKFYEIS